MLEHLKIKALTVCILLFGGITEGYSAPGDADSEPLSDVRVLIDVSGSMKQNDPGNIRIPALKLLVNLLPPDSRAGVWLFAAESTPLVPVGSVNSEWKARALESATDIHSRGLFTNIEDALKGATEGWQSEHETIRKSIILLTDGVVDVSKDPEASAASRAAILDRMIPGLQRLSARVHTLALSENADHELLKKLSLDTGGWSQSVQSAVQLERAFLTIFRTAVPMDSVPLTDNQFTIDAGVAEFSVLVFRKPGAQPTSLLDPEQTRINPDNQGENIRWHREANYDLITIEQPKSGEWQLLADLDPDNQVMVVTDLKLRLNELPNYVSENEAVDFSASITEKGETVINRDFLGLIKIHLQQSDELGRMRDWDLEADPAKPGTFKQTVGETLSPGKHTFKLVAHSQTFQREAEHRIEVVENPVNQEKQQTSKNDRDQDSLPNKRADGAIQEPDWITTGVIAGAVNLVFLLGGFFLYRFIQKRLAKQQMDLIDRLAT